MQEPLSTVGVVSDTCFIMGVRLAIVWWIIGRDHEGFAISRGFAHLALGVGGKANMSFLEHPTIWKP